MSKTNANFQELDPILKLIATRVENQKYTLKLIDGEQPI